MKAATLIGIILGTLAIFGAFLWEGGQISALFMLPAMIIVFGGTLAAGIAGTSWEQFIKLPVLTKIAFFPKKYDLSEIINQIYTFAIKSRKEGILSLEDELHKVSHPHLKKFLEICIDGADPEILDSIAQLEISNLNDRHNENIGLFTKMGGYSPTMGIIGTVMGLISTLAAAGSDPNVLIHHIASAFIATMWGIFMANIVWLPIADKLRFLHNQELALINLILDGVRALQLGEIPSVIQARLVSALPIVDQIKILEGKQINYATANPDEQSKSYSSYSYEQQTYTD